MAKTVEELLGAGPQIVSGTSAREGGTCNASLRMYSQLIDGERRGQTVFEFIPPTGLPVPISRVRVDRINVEAFSQTECSGNSLCWTGVGFASADSAGEQWPEGTPAGLPPGEAPEYPFPIPMDQTEAGYFRSARIDAGVLQALLRRCGCDTQGGQSVKVSVNIAWEPNFVGPCNGYAPFDFCDECTMRDKARSVKRARDERSARHPSDESS